MAVRNEWSEWHLTPRGWERGSTRVQGRGNTWVDEPEDRVLSYVYREVETSASPEAQRTAEETWRTKQVEIDVEALLLQHGPSPRKL